MFFDFLSLIFGKVFLFTGLVQGKGSFPKPLPPEEEKKYLAAARAGDAEAKTKLIEIYPVTWNDPALALTTVENLKAFGVDAEISKWNPGASEDFSFFAEKVPSVFMFLGVDKPGVENAPNNHSDRFTIDDAALPAGVRAHIAAAMCATAK